MRNFKLPIILSLSAAICLATTAARAIVAPSGDAARFADQVVMVLTRGGEGSGLCTGVVLSPRIVLTAAHCLRRSSDMRIFFHDAAGQAALIEVAATLAHPDYHADAAARRVRSLDVGLIETRQALPEAFRPATLATGEAPEPGAAVTVAGFGVSREGEWKSGGRLAEAKLRVREPRSAVLMWAAPPEGDSGACAGDSGGPMFGEEENTVVAIVAWTEGSGKAKCGRLTQGVLVAPLRAWVATAIRRLDGETAAQDRP